MQDDIISYIRACDTCQKRAHNKDISAASLVSIRVEPFSYIKIDIIGLLPVSLTRKRYIILAVDFFTKYTEVIAIEEANVQTVVRFLHSNIICRYEVPKKITSDRGIEFLNDLVREFKKTYYIKYIKTTAYHPQRNEQIECTNYIVKNILTKMCKDHDY